MALFSCVHCGHLSPWRVRYQFIGLADLNRFEWYVQHLGRGLRRFQLFLAGRAVPEQPDTLMNASGNAG
jgi:hypothetical protein